MTHGEGWQFIQAGRYLERAVARFHSGGRALPRISSTRPSRRGARLSGVDRIAALLHRVRSLLQSVHGGRESGPHRRVPGAASELSAFHPLLGRSAGNRHQGNRPGSGSRRARASSASRDACAPRSASARSTRSWPAGLHAYLQELLRQCGQVHSALYQTYITYPIEAALGGIRRIMFYSIRHLTRFRYKTPVSESLMELRMHPRTEGAQRCLSFHLSVSPRTRVYDIAITWATPSITSMCRGSIAS